jgi:hypothetical protein
MAIKASTAGSVYGMTCTQCGNSLIAPELSECVSEGHIRHLWHCASCCCQSEMSTYFSFDTESNIDNKRAEEAFGRCPAA